MWRVEVTFHKLEKRARKEHTRASKREGDCVCLDDTPSTRGKEKDALVDGCELSEEAPTVETTERGR